MEWHINGAAFKNNSRPPNCPLNYGEIYGDIEDVQSS